MFAKKAISINEKSAKYTLYLKFVKSFIFTISIITLFPLYYLYCINLDKTKINSYTFYNNPLSKDALENDHEKSVGLIRFLFSQIFSKNIPENWLIKYWDRNDKFQYLWGHYEGFDRNTPAIAYRTENLIILGDKSRTIRLMPHEIGHLYANNNGEAVPIFMNLIFSLKYVELFGYDDTARDLLGGFIIPLLCKTTPLTNNTSQNLKIINSESILKYHYSARLIFEYILNGKNLNEILNYINPVNFDLEYQLQINQSNNISLDNLRYEQILSNYYNFLLNNLGKPREKEIYEILYDFSRDFSINYVENDLLTKAFIEEFWAEILRSKNTNEFIKKISKQVTQYYKKYPASGKNQIESIVNDLRNFEYYSRMNKTDFPESEKVKIINKYFSNAYRFYYKKRNYELINRIVNNRIEISRRY